MAVSFLALEVAVGETHSSHTHPEFVREQTAIDHLYQLLDEKHRRYRQAQKEAMANTGAGTPQSLVERDVISAHFGAGAAALEEVEDRLVFGRLDRDSSAHPVYVGRIGLADDNGQAMIDWRAEAARPYYQATAANPLGLIRRRHIGLALRRVKSLDDDVFDATAAAALGGNVRGEGALLAALGRARSAHMSDIVATIQAEQDRVIRHGAKQILIIEGGPGTGKTAVALHRAAYLLYTQRERLARAGVLVVGPSRQFLSYIEKVLPALGETGVVATTIGNLLPGISAGAETDARIGEIKGRGQWVSACRRLVRQLVRTPADDLSFQVGVHRISLAKEKVLEAQKEALEANESHHGGWEIFATRIVGELTRALSAAESGVSEAATSAPSQWDFNAERIRSNPQIRRAVNLLWLPYEPQQLLRRLWSDRQLLERVAPFLSATERELLYRDKSAPITAADVPIIDWLAELLGPVPQRLGRSGSDEELGKRQQLSELERAREAISALGEDEAGLVSAEAIMARAQAEQVQLTTAEAARSKRSWTYGHIVVDEAQEITEMAWHALLRRCPSRSMTVVGDLAQRSTLPPVASWDKALGPASRGLEAVETLTVCYRTPAEIIEAATAAAKQAGLMAISPLSAARSIPGCLKDWQARPGQLAEVMAAALIELHQQLPLAADEGLTAMIIPDGDSAYRQLAEAVVEHTRGQYQRRQTVVLSADEAKGLEFDGTVVVDPAAIASRSAAAVYVALTRSTQITHRVTVRH